MRVAWPLLVVLLAGGALVVALLPGGTGISPDFRRAGSEPDPDPPILMGTRSSSPGPVCADAEAGGQAPEGGGPPDDVILPPDPVERGSCRLELEFVDGATGEPMVSTYCLWRLDAPEGEGWTRGDQRVLTLESDDWTETVEDLAEGRYRLHVHAAKPDGEDPRPFDVRGPVTRVRVEVDAPPSIEVELIVFDERGGRLDRAFGEWLVFGATESSPPIPSWVQARRRKTDGTRFEPEPGECEVDGDGVCWDGKAGFAEAGRFVLGAYRGTTRTTVWEECLRLRFDGRAAVEVTLESEQLPRTPLVALAYSLDELRRRLVLGDGTPLTMPGYTLEATFDAVPQKPGADPWATASRRRTQVVVKRGETFVGVARVSLRDERVVVTPLE